MKNFFTKFKWFSIGAFIAWVVLPAVVYAVVSVPNATQKGDLPTGLTTGNYQLLHPGADGTFLRASSTSPNGLDFASTASSGCTASGTAGTLQFSNGSGGCNGSSLLFWNNSANVLSTPGSVNASSSRFSNATTSTLSVTGVLNGLLSTDGVGFVKATSTPYLTGLVVSGIANFATLSPSSIVITNSAKNLTSIAATSTSVIYVDANRADPFLSNGSYLLPYKTLTAAIAGSTGYSAYTYNLAPGGTYAEGNLTFPSVPVTIYGNQSTLVLNGGTGNLTISKDVSAYDLILVGNYVQNDTSITAVHQLTNSTVSGNVTVSGSNVVVGGALASGVVYSKPGSVLALTGNFITSRVVTDGQLYLTSNAVQVTDNSNYAITATTTGSQLYVSLAKIYNFGTGGAINCANGATSTPNEIIGVDTFVAGATKAIDCGTAVSSIQDYTGTNLTNGATVPATGSAFQAGTYSGLITTATSTLATTSITQLGVGTTAPQKLLHVFGSQAGGIMRVERDAGVGILPNTFYGTQDVRLFSTTSTWPNLAGPTQTFSIATSTASVTLGDIGAWRIDNDQMGAFFIRGYNNVNGSSAKLEVIGNPFYASIFGTGSPGAANVFGIASSSGARLFDVNGNGNVGVNTSTPVALFTIQGKAGVTPFLISSSSGLSLFSIDTAGATLLNNINYTWPVTQGASSTVLTTNGSGQLSWGTVTGGSGCSASGVAGTVQFSDGASGCSGDGSNFFWDNSLKVLGIGTSTPNAGLTIQGPAGRMPFSVASSTGSRLFEVEMSGNIGINSTSATSLLSVVGYSGSNIPLLTIASSSGASLLTILSSGKVGIGSSSPSSALVIDNGQNATSSMRLVGKGCIALDDTDGTGTTFCTANNGTLTCGTAACK